MGKNVFATLKTMPEKWHETGETVVLPKVKVCISPLGFMGTHTIMERINDSKCLCQGILFTSGSKVKTGDILYNVEAFELRKEGSDETVWRLRIKE